MNNENNLSNLTGKTRSEPFAFSLHELPKEINNVQITSYYTSNFEPFNENDFLTQIKILLFDLP